jgi:hypothetical protein
MRSFPVLAVLVIVLVTGRASISFAAGEVPAPKQEIKYDYSGPYKHLIGFWSGNLRNPYWKNANVPNWDFDLYVISIIEGKSSGFYCWGAVGNVVPGCRMVAGTVDPVEEKLIFQWDDKVIKLLRTQKVIYQKSGGIAYEGMATKFEK